jgi:transcriptional regulator with XRE-family HTH domain
MPKTDQERGPIGAWMRRERLAHQWTPADVVARLGRKGAPILEGSYRGYEAGPRPPSEQIIRALEAVFGSQAPDTKNEPAEPQGLDGLIAAIQAQTEAINRLVDRLGASPQPTDWRSLARMAAQMATAPSIGADEAPGESPPAAAPPVVAEHEAAAKK